jgi:DegV family protein with EDD domain
MNSIAVVTDTDASLPPDLAARHGISLVPISVQFGAQSLDTGTGIDDAALFARVNREGKIPTTAAPTPGRFAESFRAALDAGAKAILCFCVSSKVSASYQSACTARDLLPDADITVVDSNSLSMGQGFMAIAAAETIAAGATKVQAIETASDVRNRAHLFVALSTLRYLAMSGRVGHLTAGMATLLDVKPILTIQDGKLEILERVRTQRKARAHMIELCQRAAVGKPIERMALVHVTAADEVRQFQRELCACITCPAEPVLAELTPGLSVHAGAGVVGVVLISGK